MMRVKVDVLFQDKQEICDKSYHRTPEGYLRLQAIIARSGSQNYMKSELGLCSPGINDSHIMLNRPVEEVTSPLSMSSFIINPITNEHPECGYVDINNYAKHSKGIIVDVDKTDGGRLKADILVTNLELINSIELGKKELSAGYRAELEFSKDGTTATQKNIRGNHVAFVNKSRCGSECSIIDARKDIMSKITINKVEVEITDAALPLVNQLISENETLVKQVVTLKDSVSSTQAKLDAATDEVKAIKDTNLTDTEIVELAETMAKLWSDVKIVDSEYDCKGKTSEVIRKEIVVSKIGDSMKDKEDAYISARFDVLVTDAEERSNDPLSDSLKNKGGKINITDISQITEDARQRKMKRNEFKQAGDDA